MTLGRPSKSVGVRTAALMLRDPTHIIRKCFCLQIRGMQAADKSLEGHLKGRHREW